MRSPKTRTGRSSPHHAVFRPSANRVDADALALARGLLETNLAVDQREERVIAAHPHVGPGPHGGPALADEDGPGRDPLPVAALHAEPPARAVAAVPRATHSLLVCHVGLPLGLLGHWSRSSRCLRGSFSALLGGRRGRGRGSPSLDDDVGDAESRQLLPMAGLAAVPYLRLEAEDYDLL